MAIGMTCGSRKVEINLIDAQPAVEAHRYGLPGST